MGDIAKLVGRFFARDYMYFLAGLNIILSLVIANIYAWNQKEPIAFISNMSSVLLVPISGIAYVLGYAVNYLFGLLGIHASSDRLVPWSGVQRRRGIVARYLFRRLNGYDIDEVARYIDDCVIIRDHKQIPPSAIFALQALHSREDYLSVGFIVNRLWSSVPHWTLGASDQFLAPIEPDYADNRGTAFSRFKLSVVPDRICNGYAVQMESRNKIGKRIIKSSISRKCNAAKYHNAASAPRGGPARQGASSRVLRRQVLSCR
jgi:hypothetical protein